MKKVSSLSTRIFHRAAALTCLSRIVAPALALSLGANAVQAAAPSVNSPFGVAASHSSTGSVSSWMPQMSTAGLKWVRAFHNFSEIEPTQGTWVWSGVDSLLSTAAANNLNISGIFSYSTSWIDSSQSGFPIANLPAWSTYVSNVVTHCSGKVKYYEVWNEPPNFASNAKPADYASIVVSAYNAAKAADPSTQIGLCAASNYVNWLDQAIVAGAADHFDYIAVHPYECMGTIDSGFEAAYMSIVPTIRKMLAARNPAKVNVPIWFTESGQPVGTQSAAAQAQKLVKIYTMGIAQGVIQINWFEGKDGDSGPFGLLDSSGAPRPSYTAMSKLIQYLGNAPQYKGWVLLNGKDYGFVFQGATGTVLSTWAPPGTTDAVNFGSSVQIVDPASGAITNSSTYTLTNAPILVIGVPASIVAQAQVNKTQPFFPWNGNYLGDSSVSLTAGGPNSEAGLHQLNADSTSTAVTVYGGPARDCSKSGSQSFTVDPVFLSYSTEPIVITAVVRRDAANDNAGFNLKYESDTGWSGGPGWFTVPGNTQWYTKSWTINDPQFVGKWGYNFSFDSDSSSNSKYYIQSVSVQRLKVLSFQTESLAVLNSSGDTHRVFSAPFFTDGNGTILDANAVGDFVTYTVPNIAAGTYNVKVGMKKFNPRGTFQLAAARADTPNGFTNIGSTVDEFDVNEIYTEVDLGSWSPGSTSDKAFRFTVTGKNAGSSGYSIAFDYIKLTSP